MKIALVYSEYEDLPQKVYKINPYGPIQMKNTKRQITKALEMYGHEVYPVMADTHMLENIMDIEGIDVIFCHYMPMLDLGNQGNVFAALELLGLPIVGSGMFSQAVSLSKETTKLILREENIPTAESQVFHSQDEPLKEELKDKFPLFIKPESESGSVGITKDSYVENEEELKDGLKKIFSYINPPILVEEYLPGREFTVGVLDGEPPIALPIFEFIYKKDEDVKFQSVTRKANGDIEVKCPADISKELETTMKKMAVKSFIALEAEDYFRVDFRLDRNGKAKVIEVNTMPGLEYETSFFNRAAKVAGISFPELINRLVEHAYKKEEKKREFEVGRF